MVRFKTVLLATESDKKFETNSNALNKTFRILFIETLHKFDISLHIIYIYNMVQTHANSSKQKLIIV